MKNRIKIIIAIITIILTLSAVSFLLLKKYNSPIKTGDLVIYEPPISTYTINQSYINHNNNEIKVSNTDDEYKISEWVVFKVNKDNIEIVPKKITKSLIKLEGAQGYNNGVFFLNEICSNLYSDKTKNISARSITIEDIEQVIDSFGNIKEFEKTKSKNDNYNLQLKKEGYYGEYSYYPIIYEYELNSIIDNNKSPKSSLKPSDSLERYIEGNEDNAINGVKKPSINISPYKTFYYTFNYDNTIKIIRNNKYKEILLPEEISTSYWIATRAIGNGNNSVHYDIRRIYNGVIRAGRMYDSNNVETYEKSHIFPIVTVDIKLLSKEKIDGKGNVFIVK